MIYFFLSELCQWMQDISVYTVFSSVPYKLHQPWPSWPHTMLPERREPSQSPSGFPYSAPQSRTCFQAVNVQFWCSSHLFPFSQVAVTYFLMLSFLKTNDLYMLFSFLFVSGRRVNLVSVIPSWLEGEIHSSTYKMFISPKFDQLIFLTLCLFLSNILKFDTLNKCDFSPRGKKLFSLVFILALDSYNFHLSAS